MKIDDTSIAKAMRAALDATSIGHALIGDDSIQRVALVGNVGATLNVSSPSSLDDDAVHPYMITLEHARVSEAQGAGSLRACVVYAERLLRGAQAPSEVVGRAFTSKDVDGLLTGVLDRDDVAALSRVVLDAGSSRYVVDRTPSRFDSVEYVDSYEFKHVSKPIDGTVVMDNARFLVADGYVENVSEIHPILDRCSRDKERLIICGRGFSDDVLHTLAVNRARGTLAAYALTFPFDQDDANTLVDVATIVGGDVLSSLKGQLYGSVDVSGLPRVPYARLRGQTLDFRGEGSSARAAVVLASVRQKAADSEEPVRSVLEKRARRLSGSCVIVRLKDDVEHRARVEAWDVALRTLSLAARGVQDVDDREAWPGRRVIPLLSRAAAQETARKLLAALRSLDRYV